MVAFGPSGLGGRPNRFGEFGFTQKPWKFLRARSPNFWWFGGGPPNNLIILGPKPPRPEETMGNMGLFNPDFPQSSAQTPRGKKGDFFVLSKIPCGELLGTIWAEDPPFSAWFSFGLGSGHPGQRKPKRRLRDFEPALFQNCLGRSLGRIRAENPQFPYGYLWPGWLGWPPTPNGLKFQRAGLLRSSQ